MLLLNKWFFYWRFWITQNAHVFRKTFRKHWLLFRICILKLCFFFLHLLQQSFPKISVCILSARRPSLMRTSNPTHSILFSLLLAPPPLAVTDVGIITWIPHSHLTRMGKRVLTTIQENMIRFGIFLDTGSVKADMKDESQTKGNTLFVWHYRTCFALVLDKVVLESKGVTESTLLYTYFFFYFSCRLGACEVLGF